MSEVKEGFLCPICFADLGDEFQLTVHFDEKHSKEDPAIVQGFKEFIAKSKKTILNAANNIKEIDNNDIIAKEQAEFSKQIYGLQPSEYHPVSGIHYDILDQQNGADNTIPVVDKFSEFRSKRAERADKRAMDINKLIIRLERLMSQLPNDPRKKRIHEKNVVEWIDEKLVPNCPQCTKSFNLTRRPHHCRLCGGVMCESCSEYIHFDLAQRLINPASISKFSNNETNEKEANSSPTKSKLNTSIDGLVSNLVDLAGFSEDLKRFRCCLHCKDVLEERDKRLRMTTAADPDIVKYYTHLQSILDEGRNMSEKYSQMNQSLYNGESTYQIEEVKILRVKIERAAASVDAISKKIASLPVQDTKTESLQNRIRMASFNFVKETLVGLPSAPTPEEFEQIKIQKAQEAVKRIEIEKQKALEAKIKSEKKERSLKKSASVTGAYGASPGLANFTNTVQTTFTNSRRQLKFTKAEEVREGKIGQGFVASVGGQETVQDDPFGQQIHNLKQFIQQAKAAGKHDDALNLEANLKEIQAEYRKRKIEEQKELRQNYEEFKDLFSKPKSAVAASDEALDESNPFFEDEEELAAEISNGIPENNPFGEFENDNSNPFQVDEDDDYDNSGKNPFS